MTGCPVNIADFRCRAIQGREIRTPQSTERPLRTLMVVSRPEQKAEFHKGGTPAAMSRVCDIGLAREARRVRRHMVMLPIPIERRSNVIGFGESKLRAMEAGETGPPPQWAGQPDDPCDFPPAA